MHGITGEMTTTSPKRPARWFSTPCAALLGKDGGVKDVRKVARDSLLSLLWERTKQRPMVIVSIIEV